MQSVKSTQNGSNAAHQSTAILNPSELTRIQPPEKKPLTFGQRLADKMASKVGNSPD